MERLTMVANNIKFYRNRNHWTQEDLSIHLNVSRSNISKWESGDMTPSLIDLLRISNLFKIKIDQLVGVNSISKEYLMRGDDTPSITLGLHPALHDVIDYLIQNPTVIQALKDLSTQKPTDRRKLEGVIIYLIKALKG